MEKEPKISQITLGQVFDTALDMMSSWAIVNLIVFGAIFLVRGISNLLNP